jgi:hypothetical protein
MAMIRVLVLHLAALAVLLVGSHAWAAVGFLGKNTPATRFDIKAISVTSGQPVTVSTFGLSAGSDTVLHIQKFADGTFIAGNDDSNGSFASTVTFTPNFTGLARVITRAYGDTTFGSCTLRWTIGGVTTDTAIQFGGRSVFFSGDMTRGRVLTVEEPGGAADTTLLVVNTNSAHAVRFSDDEGLEAMAEAFIPSNDPCVPSCRAVVGTWSGSSTTPQFTTLIADSDQPGNDADIDGLGAVLESAIGTSPSDADTDNDGIADGPEVVGMATTPAVKFPFYGADPLRKDIFVEFDYETSTQNKMPVAKAEEFANVYGLAGIRAHLDIGVSNTDPATRQVWNDWGGTNLQSPATHCSGLTPQRNNRFHHAIIQGHGGGGQHRYQPFSCFVGGSSAAKHEVGHYRLLHDGNFPHETSMNCNPFYFSTMNYGYNFDGMGFSPGTGPSGNSIAINEVGWGNHAFFPSMSHWPWSYAVNAANGWVDWNRDGVVNAEPIRAPLNWSASDCDPTIFARNRFEGTDSRNNPVLTWVAQPGSSPFTGTLFMFARTVSGGIQYKYATKSALSGCTAVLSNRHQSCATWSPATSWAGITNATSPVAGSIAAADIGSGKILVVYRNSASFYVSQIGTVNFSTGSVSWAAPALLFVANGASGEMTLAVHDGIAHVFLIQNGFLHDMTYNPATNIWLTPVIQSWAPPLTGNVPASLGIGVTTGFFANGTTNLVAAIPDSNGALVIAKRQLNGTWIAYNAATVWPTGAPRTVGRPSLAYVSPAGGSSGGRYYVAFPSVAIAGAPAGVPKIAMTEGNDDGASATNRRFSFKNGAINGMTGWVVAAAGEGMSLTYRAGLDTNLRMAYTLNTGLEFAPLADGVVNHQLTDHNDYAALQDAKDCALFACCDAPSNCPWWIQ